MKKNILGFVLTILVLINASESYSRSYVPVATGAIIASSIAMSSNMNSRSYVRCADINNDEARLNCYDREKEQCKFWLIYFIGFILSFIVSVVPIIKGVSYGDSVKDADLDEFAMGVFISFIASLFSWLSFATLVAYFIIKRLGGKN